MSRNRREGLGRKNARGCPERASGAGPGASASRDSDEPVSRVAGERDGLRLRKREKPFGENRRARTRNDESTARVTESRRSNARITAPPPRLARAFFAISSQVPSTLLRVTPSQRSRARARVTSARPTCRARPPSSAARWGSPCRCTSTPCASSRSCAVRPPPPLARRPSRIPRAPLAPRRGEFLTRAPIRPFRVCSPPRARRAASRSSARDAFVRATPGPRRPARRPADLARRAAPLTPRPAPHIIVSCLLFPNTTRRPLGARLLGGRGRRGGELERGVGGETSRGGGRAQRGEASDEREVHGVHRQGQVRRGPRASASPGGETATGRKAATFKGTSPRDGEASNRHEAASRRRAGVRVGRKRARAAARCNCNAKER